MGKKSKCCISGESLNAVAVAFANTIAKDLTIVEISQISALFTVIGDALALIAASRQICEDQSPADNT